MEALKSGLAAAGKIYTNTLVFGLFSKKLATVSFPSQTPNVADLDSLKATIAADKANDPLIGPKVGAKQINQRLMALLKTAKGIHAESFLAALGSVAGFSCQMSVRAIFTKSRTALGPGPYPVVQGADGKKYYFGDVLNKPLAESPYSIWSLAAGAVQNAGAEVPDVAEIFKHVAATVGGPQFGLPRIPADHDPGNLPINYLRSYWLQLFPVAEQLCDDPAQWPVFFAIAVQQAITMVKAGVYPTLGATIVMECAIPMSKVDLPEFYTGTSSPWDAS